MLACIFASEDWVPECKLAKKDVKLEPYTTFLTGSRQRAHHSVSPPCCSHSVMNRWLVIGSNDCSWELACPGCTWYLDVWIGILSRQIRKQNDYVPAPPLLRQWARQEGEKTYMHADIASSYPYSRSGRTYIVWGPLMQSLAASKMRSKQMQSMATSDAAGPMDCRSSLAPKYHIRLGKGLDSGILAVP